MSAIVDVRITKERNVCYYVPQGDTYSPPRHFEYSSQLYNFVVGKTDCPVTYIRVHYSISVMTSFRILTFQLSNYGRNECFSHADAVTCADKIPDTIEDAQQKKGK